MYLCSNLIFLFFDKQRKITVDGFFSTDQTVQQKAISDSRTYGNIKAKATHYGKTCEVPEPWCNDCAKQHTRQTLSKDHELCDKIREFSDHQKVLSAK